MGAGFQAPHHAVNGEGCAGGEAICRCSSGLGRSGAGRTPALYPCCYRHVYTHPNTHTQLTLLNHHHIMSPVRRLLSAQALLSQLEKQASDVATSAAAAANRRRELEKKQEELKNNLKVGVGPCVCVCGGAFVGRDCLSVQCCCSSVQLWLKTAAGGSCCASLAQHSLLKLFAVSVPLLL